MNKEEIEEIETLEIDFEDTDELELALEVSSKKAIYLIDNLIKSLFELQQENKILKENAENNDKVADKVNWENQLLKKENKQLKEEKRKVRDYINKYCVNEKISKEVGYKCYTMVDTNELEKIMKILGDK